MEAVGVMAAAVIIDAVGVGAVCVADFLLEPFVSELCLGAVLAIGATCL